MFSDILTELLGERGINTLRLAKEIGVPKSLVYEWKNGEREPSVANMVKIRTISEFRLNTLPEKPPFPHPTTAKKS